MTRSISKGLGGILEQLELNRPELVTMCDIERMAAEQGISTPARVVAGRLRERGWLLPTAQRGVWEFAPAELAGAYSSFDPLLGVKAFSSAHPDIDFGLAGQSAAWALGLADRVPSIIEVAFRECPRVKVPADIHGSVYAPQAEKRRVKGVDVLSPESILVHMCARPSAVRAWVGTGEWLPDVAYELDADLLLAELAGRADSVRARVGYLLQGMRPDISSLIEQGFAPRTKTRFGTSGSAKRNDEHWKVSDAVLPFDPREMEAVR